LEADKFHDFVLEMKDMFLCRSWDVTGNAYRYLCGLLQTERRKGNMERMVEEVPDLEYQSIQQFISDSPWSSREVMDRVALEVSDLFQGADEVGLLLDETYFQKSGRFSVGVSRQWNGRLGKKENSQVAVFAALAAGDRCSLIDTEFFLPEAWTDDIGRMSDVGVPSERHKHKTKIELAKDIVRRQREIGTYFDYVCADGLYGHSGEFCRWLDDCGEKFLLHVHVDQLIYLEDPRPFVPEGTSDRGRKPSKLKVQVAPMRVDEFIGGLKDADWEQVFARDTTRGPLALQIFSKVVWLWDGEEKQARKWTLFVRKDFESEDLKYALTNSLGESALRLAQWEMQRYRIERSFQDGKQEVSMGDYQTRGWVAWHHHMSLVMMAMLFITRTRMLHHGAVPMLSAADIRRLLAFFLPQKRCSKSEVFEQMKTRHEQRRESIENKTREKERKLQEADFQCSTLGP
jgi:SRSO17 transposase